MNLTYPRALGPLALALCTFFSPAHANTTPSLIGVNLSGGEFATNGAYPGNYGTQYYYPPAMDIDTAKALGAELIRVPIVWERIQHETNGVLDANLWQPDMDYLDASISAMEARGMRIIIDLHNYNGRKLTIGGTTSSYMLGSAELPVSEFARVWRLLADHFKNRPSIWGYDLLNEPGRSNDFTTAQWVQMAQAAVNAIREVDTNTAIILEGGPNWNHASSWSTTGAPLLAVVDPANNLVFSAHCYTDRFQNGQWSQGGTVDGELVGAGKPYSTHEAALNVGVDRVKPFVDWCVANNVRGLVGEYASPPDIDEANWNIVFDRMLDYMVNHGNGLISGTQWSGGSGVSDRTRVFPRKDNSIASYHPVVLSKYVSGAGTNYWPYYAWYDEIIKVSADYSYPYSFASSSPAATCTLTIDDTTNPRSGTKSAAFSYAVPPGGFAGGGLHIHGPLVSNGVGGVDLAHSIAAGHVLSFWARGTPGATPSITLGSTSDATGVDSGSDTATGVWINLASIAPLTTSWQRYEIPISSFLSTQLAGVSRVQRIRFNGLPANGNAYQVNFDRITIEAPSTNAGPTVTIATPGGGTNFSAGPLTLTATASDANAGDTIDYVEFYVDTDKVGMDATAPYSWTTTITAPGPHTVRALAFDNHGAVGGSAPFAFTITSVAGAPTGLTATPGNSRVLLAWSPSSGATSYNVKRAGAPGGPYTTVGTPTSTSFTDTGLTNTTTYYYVVSAVNGSVESANSTEVSATPRAITLIQDNTSASGTTFSGAWVLSTSASGAYGGSYHHDNNTGATEQKSVTYTPTITVAGNYHVYARWTAGANRATAAHYDVTHAAGTTTSDQNQRVNNNTWVSLGTFYFNAGSGGSVRLRNDGADGYVIADAVQFVLE